MYDTALWCIAPTSVYRSLAWAVCYDMLEKHDHFALEGQVSSV